ncbi:Glucan 1,3-beta-glucosidase 3 [Coemansia sp. RSA 1250]|nr:Glucan 1,3-beta-glucosidase 3 [Coemansia sp. RSA 1250]
MQLGTFATFDPAKAQVFRFRKLYGVNLGSMFCLEPWIATELYKDYQQHSPEAECDLLECMGDEACEKMEAHWNSWLQRADFEKMASMGINSVRLPVGYWVLGRHFTMGKYASYKGVYDNALSHISRIISWAAEFDIGVLIDIHALPGGQNNDSHSGTTGTACFYDNPEFQHLAIKCYGVFAHLLANITNVIGLQIINEPLDHPQLGDFYKQALSEIRLQTTDLPIYIGDAWNLTKYAKIAKELSQQFGFIVVDTHRYWVFRPQKQQYRVDRLTKELWETTFPELSQASHEASGNLVIGEYSSVLANGSFDGEDPAECMGKFAREQLKAFDQFTMEITYTKSLQPALLSSNFLLAVFGGQPSSADYTDEAKWLLNMHAPLLTDFVSSMSNFLETQSQDKNFSQVYGCGFDVFSWLVRPRSMPDYDYIALVPVKMPVTGLIQLMQVMVLFKTLNVSPGKLLRFFEAATEHSQEMVTAVAFSMMSDEQSFYRIGFKVLGILMLTSATPCINMWKQNALDEAYDSDDSGVEVANTPASRAQIRDIENAYLHQKKELQDTWGNKFWKQDAEISPLRGSLAV